MDLLVKLYDLPELAPVVKRVEAQNVTVRKPIGPEKSTVIAWITTHYGVGWGSEADTAFCNANRTLYVAFDENQTQAEARIVGFACYDATAKGFFGPIAVSPEYRRRGIGQALLLSCLHNLKLDGYGYAVIGSISHKARDFYSSTLPGAVEIPESNPGIYKGMTVDHSHE